MKRVDMLRIGAIGLMILGTSGASHSSGQPFNPADAVGLRGGLVVQLGASETRAAAELSLTGRYLIHVLDADAGKVESARAALRAEGQYGLAWAEQPTDTAHLPYAENIVNLIVIRDYTVSVDELARVLVPGGSVLVIDPSLLDEPRLEASGFELAAGPGTTRIARKPLLAAMDDWTHPRHAADGNAVSNDTLVGPPDRVRWVAAATSEVEGMVSAGGRNFYGGVLARDSFNGLRLWHRDLTKDEDSTASFELPRLPVDGARPVASDRLLFGVLQNRPVALDAATGEVVVGFGDMTNPTAIIHDGHRVIAADANSVQAFQTDDGRQIWKVQAASPNNVVADGGIVVFIHGRARRGEKPEAVALNGETGDVLWRHDDYPWLNGATRTVLAQGLLVFEVSTFNDNDAGNGIHVVSAADGKHQWSKEYAPGMNHTRQARAMLVDDDLWILHGGKINTADKDKMIREAIQISALNPRTGETRKTFPAGLTHCFPPVCTPNFMFAGEMDLTNLKSGEVVANRITKANCSRENGWVPANGLVYTTPKHCTCWPMLRGFVAMAPATVHDSPTKRPLDQLEFLLETGTARPDPNAPNPQPHDWPLYRNDRWRSASTAAAGPVVPSEKWRIAVDPGQRRDAPRLPPILSDWSENPVIKGPISAPTIANGTVFVTRPDAHELIAIDSASGGVRWRFTANGRVDTPPAIHGGLCLIGTANGWVYSLRADTGEVVWRLRAAPTEERIVAYGQVESPWPVPGAVLVMDDIAYFAAGRQPLADGGILIFAVDPRTGKQHWVQRINTVPQQGFYENSGLEFDPFDILHAEGDGLAMSRWVLSRDGQQIAVDKWNAFAKLNTGGGEVWIPRGAWTYGARHQHRFRGEAPRRPLIAFRDDNIYSSLDGTTQLFRRDFDLDKGEVFNSKWITGWQAAQEGSKGGTPYRNHRIAEGAKWTTDPFADPTVQQTPPAPGTQLQNRVHALALAGDKLYAVHQDGRLRIVSVSDGHVIHESNVPPPAWDGLAIAEGRLYLSTQGGELVCLDEAK